MLQHETEVPVHVHHPALFLSAQLGAALLLAVLLLGVGRSPHAPTAALAGGKDLPRVTVTARAGGLDAPAAVPTGLVAVTFRNATPGEFYASILRLNDGATPNAVLAAFEAEDQAALSRLATAIGGPGGILPGQSQEIVFNLQAGIHLLVTFNETSEEPVITAVRAMPPLVASDPPATAGTIELGEFYFRTPVVQAGTTTFTVTNVGQQLHHMIVARLAPGVTVEQALAAEQMGVDAVEAGLVTVVPGLSEMSPGQTVYPTLTFTPGTYAMVCFITDPASGAPHLALGMVQEFTVR